MSYRGFPPGAQVQVLGDDNQWHYGVVYERITTETIEGKDITHKVHITGEGVPSHMRDWYQPYNEPDTIRKP